MPPLNQSSEPPELSAKPMLTMGVLIASTVMLPLESTAAPERIDASRMGEFEALAVELPA